MAKASTYKYVIKNIETNEFFMGWEPALDKNGQWLKRPPVHASYWKSVFVKKPKFSKIIDELPKIYNSHNGARKIISEFVGTSLADQDKLNNAEKVLFGDKELAKYVIVRCRIKLIELKG